MRSKVEEIMHDMVLTPFSPIEPHILEITYRGEDIAGSVTTRVEGDSLVLFQLEVEDMGVVNKEFLQSLSGALEDLAREKNLSNVKIEHLPQHLRMFKAAGFDQVEGETGLVARHVSRGPEPTGTRYQDTWLYHATTYDTYHNQIKNYGVMPQPLTDDVAAIVGFSSGIYLANSVEAAKDLAVLKYGEGKYVILHIKLPAGTQLEIDPEIGEPDSPWFITPSIIPSENIVILNVGGQAPAGTCYQDAWRFLIKQDEGFLIHGSTQLSPEAPRVNHAWVELTTGWVWEPQTGQYFTTEDFRIMNPEEHHRYTSEEAAIMIARTSNMGPWTDEERTTWLQEGAKAIPAVGEYPARIGIIPKLPEEARGDILFFEFIRDLSRYEALSEEDVQRYWEGYKVQHGL